MHRVDEIYTGVERNFYNALTTQKHDTKQDIKETHRCKTNTLIDRIEAKRICYTRHACGRKN